MEVTRDNFKDVLPLLQEAINSAVFISFDTELTGLDSNPKKRSEVWDSVEERYQKVKDSANQFLITQYGIATFHWNEDQKKWTAKVFNCYIFPKPYSFVDVRFLCQSSSLEFLTQHKFDFNKFIYKGISYLTGPLEQKLRTQMQENIEKRSTPQDEITNIEPETKKALDQICLAVDNWMKDTNPQLDTPPLNSYMRRLVRQELGKKYTNIWIETVGEAAVAVLRLVKVTEEIKKQKEAEKIEKIKQDYEDAVGFRKVFVMMCKSKKPIIGHNMMLDVAHTLEKFNNWLPRTSEEFKKELNNAFPHIFDTKYVVSKLPDSLKEKFTTGTSLEPMLATMNTDPLFKAPKIELTDMASRYKGEEFAHEAGYDAWMTGYIFIKMIHHLDPTCTSTNAIISSSALEPLKNKLPLYRSPTPFNIVGPQVETDFSKMFYVSGVTSSTVTRDIVDFFVHFAPIDVKWIDQNGLIVIVEEAAKASKVMSILGKRKGSQQKYQVIPFQEYRKKLLAKGNTSQHPTWMYVALATSLSAAAAALWLHELDL